MLVYGCVRSHAAVLHQASVLSPNGPIALTERNLLFAVTGLMLLVIVPVYILTYWFVRRYRASNAAARYLPEWSYSLRLDAAIWAAPVVIGGLIAGLIWIYTHRLDPYRPLASTVAPLKVDVVAEDWKWLFIYPEQNIAAVNELVFPAGRPLRLKITSDTVMNSIYIPGLGGQIFAMAGMRTYLNLRAEAPGTFFGMNTQYSGKGFADQHFAVRATTPAQFAAWVAKAKRSPKKLDAAAYAALAKPSSNVPVTIYSGVEPDLFARIIEKYRGPPVQREKEKEKEVVSRTSVASRGS